MVTRTGDCHPIRRKKITRSVDIIRLGGQSPVFMYLVAHTEWSMVLNDFY